jgi:outer membrane protein assembly factor BamB/HEAT repeat protein
VAGLLIGGSCAPSSHAPSISSSEVRQRLLSEDPRVRADTAEVLVKGGARSTALIKPLLRSNNLALHNDIFDILHRMGPEAIGLLSELLKDGRPQIRRRAIDLLVDLAPDTEAIQSALCSAMKDDDLVVARDAARALGALGERAGPSVPALVEALSHRDPHVRLYSAEALASVGPAAAPATMPLIRALHDPHPGVRWGACEALASIGEKANPAVPHLIDALSDEFLYVRICAAGALGSIGPAANAAIEPLRAAAKDPTLRAEAQWALRRIAGENEPVPADTPVPMVTIEPAPPPKPASANPPLDWDTDSGRNIVWSTELGRDTFGRPVVSEGVVFVGTDNSTRRNPSFTDECGVLMAFRATDGGFLWQNLAPRVKRGTGEFMLPSTTSAPHVEGDRLYYVTAECQLRCLDTRSGRLIWELDMCGKLGVFPHEASNSDVLPIGELLVVCTSNGRNEGHTRVPSPRAPSLIAVNKQTGEVVWRAIGAGEHVLHGQWCSPVAADVGGRTHVLFGGGDGWLRGYDASSGREIWRFDGNPKDSQWLPRPGVLSRSPIVASPVYADGRVFVAMGDDPSHGNGPSLLHALSPTGQGDVTSSRLLWTCQRIGRVVGTPIVFDGLLYVGDLGGKISCLDAATGAVIWQHETRGPIWGCMLLIGERLYVGNVHGLMTVVSAGRRKQVLAEFEMDSALYSRPALVGDTLYLATAQRLYLIAAKPGHDRSR